MLYINTAWTLATINNFSENHKIRVLCAKLLANGTTKDGWRQAYTRSNHNIYNVSKNTHVVEYDE